MSKMTLEQEAVRNQEYNEYVEQITPKHNLWANMGKAFLLGGGICLLGQIIFTDCNGGVWLENRRCLSLVQFTTGIALGNSYKL